MTDFTFEIIFLIGAAFILGVVAGVVLRTMLLPQGLAPLRKDAETAGTSALGARLANKSSPADREKRSGSASKETDAASGGRAAEILAEGSAMPDVQPAGSGDKDNLQEIKGIGAVLEKKLNQMGITRYQQIADWTPQDIARIDSELNFKGRIIREKWVEQARRLAASKPKG